MIQEKNSKTALFLENISFEKIKDETLYLIVDEVNDLGRRVTKNESDIKVIQTRLDVIEQTMSTIGHGHGFAGTGAVLPSTGRKGGSVRKMRKGGKFTKPVVTSIEDFKQQLIDNILDLQNHG